MTLTILPRLVSLLPAGWFARDTATGRDAVVGGVGDGLKWIGGRIAYAKAQTRIATAGQFWLDLIAWDFFAGRLSRRPSETDTTLRPRILAEILRPRATRAGISRAVSDLTGIAPDIYEPWNTGDCGAYDVGTLAYSGAGGGNAPVGGMDVGPGGYDVGGLAYAVPGTDVGGFAGAGCYGSYELPNQIFVRAYRGAGTFANAEGCGAYDTPGFAYGGDGGAVPAFPGYDSPIAGQDVGPLAYLDPPGVSYGSFPGVGFLGGLDTEGSVTDADIYAAIARTTAAGIIPWTQILPAAARAVPLPAGALDFSNSDNSGLIALV